MPLTNLKTYAMVALAVAVIAAAGVFGAQVGQWKAEAGYATERKDAGQREKTLTQENTDLRLAVAAQNAAVQLLEQSGTDGDKRRQQAEAYAATLAAFSKSRLDKLDKALNRLETADEVLDEYWELRK